MIKIGLHGASGKMGKTIIECLKNSDKAKLSVAYTIENIDLELKSGLQTDSLEVLFENSDVVIDFTILNGAKNLLRYARTNPKPLVIGTTGFDSEANELLSKASLMMPILYATNMSLGVAVANKLTQTASKILQNFDIEIVEMHHKHKKDAPSGTALTLANSAAKARGLNLKNVMVTGREGLIGARNKDEISVLSMRGGDIVGKHDVGFYGDGEFLQIIHTATSRATFANGAIWAAVWLANKEPKLYSINDCLGI